MSNINIKKEICEFKINGATYGEIARKFHKSRSTIQRIISSYGKPHLKRGPKEKLCKNKKMKMKMMINHNAELGIKSSAKDIIKVCDLNISTATVCRSLKTLQYNYRSLPFKFELSNAHRQKRLQAARSYILENINWHNVIFSDEKKFTLFGCDSHYTWVHNNKSPSRVKRILRAPSIMVWAMIMPNGLLSYKIMMGKQNSQKYISILENYALPIIRLNYEKDVIFQQDNCPIHVSKETKNFIKNQNIRFLNWPPYSPDINIIENVWHLLSEIIYKDGAIRNLKELKNRLYHAVITYNESKRSETASLYESMPRRICEVLEKKGARLKY